jgi:hypothetical protein
VCRNIADDYVIENGDNGEKYVKRMMTFDGAMNTDIDFQKLVADKEETPDKSPSHDPLKIRWTCENILEEVIFHLSTFSKSTFRLRRISSKLSRHSQFPTMRWKMTK